MKVFIDLYRQQNVTFFNYSNLMHDAKIICYEGFKNHEQLNFKNFPATALCCLQRIFGTHESWEIMSSYLCSFTPPTLTHSLKLKSNTSQLLISSISVSVSFRWNFQVKIIRCNFYNSFQPKHEANRNMHRVQI